MKGYLGAQLAFDTLTDHLIGSNNEHAQWVR